MKNFYNFLKRLLVFLESVLDRMVARKFSRGRYLNYDNECELNGDKILVYIAHLHGLFIPDFILSNIIQYKRLSYDVLLVITISNCELEDVIALLEERNVSCRILIRENFGKDFAGLADALSVINIERIKNFAFQNDSIIGPLFESNFIEKLESLDGEFVGATESYGPCYHLQSSILMLKGARAIKAASVFVLKKYKLYNNRSNIVKYGEIGLTQHMLKSGVSVSVLFPLVKLISLNSNQFKGVSLSAFNSQHDFGEFLLSECNFPFIKRELLSKNPAGKSFSWSNIELKIKAYGCRVLEESMRSRL